MAKYPCRSCVYFKACGDNMRTVPCGGRLTKKDKQILKQMARKAEIYPLIRLNPELCYVQTTDVGEEQFDEKTAKLYATKLYARAEAVGESISYRFFTGMDKSDIGMRVEKLLELNETFNTKNRKLFLVAVNYVDLGMTARSGKPVMSEKEMQIDDPTYSIWVREDASQEEKAILFDVICGALV